MIIRQFGIFFGYQEIQTENLTENQTSQPKVSLLTQLKKPLKAIFHAKNMTMIQPLTNFIQHWFSQQNDL